MTREQVEWMQILGFIGFFGSWIFALVLNFGAKTAFRKLASGIPNPKFAERFTKKENTTDIFRKLLAYFFVAFGLFCFLAANVATKLLEPPSPDQQTTNSTPNATTPSSPSVFFKMSGDTFELRENNVYSLKDGVPNKVGEATVYPSPDKTKIAVLVSGYLSTNVLLYSDSGLNGLQDIGTAEQIAWSHNSRYLAFTGRPADAGTVSRLSVYDSQTGQTSRLYEKADPKIISDPFNVGYENPRWLDDDRGVKVDYALARKKGTITFVVSK